MGVVAAVRLRLHLLARTCRTPRRAATIWSTAAIFVGATLTATSVGITARVLSDLGRMSTPEARIIIGAAVIDDVLGLVILSVVSGVAAGASVSVLGIVRTLAVAVGFLVVAVLVGRFLVPGCSMSIVRMRVRYVLLVVSRSRSRSALAGLAGLAGSALIIGAFAAGLILSGTNQFDTIEHEVRPVASIFTPIFFVSVGSSVNLALLNPATPRCPGDAGRGGWCSPCSWRSSARSPPAGPRPGPAFAASSSGSAWCRAARSASSSPISAAASGVLSDEVFGAVLLMVMVTTFIAPPALKALFASPRGWPA